MDECIFCRIANKSMVVEILYENDHWVTIRDIHPQAEVHLLFISKNHYDSMATIPRDSGALLNALSSAISKVSSDLGLESYRLISNNGASAGQTVMHLHWHLLSGKGFSLDSL